MVKKPSFVPVLLWPLIMAIAFLALAIALHTVGPVNTQRSMEEQFAHRDRVIMQAGLIYLCLTGMLLLIGGLGLLWNEWGNLFQLKKDNHDLPDRMAERAGRKQ